MNQLVDGNIPAGKECSFLEECEFKNERCPSKENHLPVDFSCAHARLITIMKKLENSSKTIVDS